MEHELARRRKNATWLSEKAGVDYGTVIDFLSARRWPQRATRGAIEAALDLAPGSLEGAALGQDPALPASGVPSRSVGPDLQGAQDDDEEILFRLRVPRGASPQQRAMARRAAEASARAVLEELDEE